MASSTRKSDYSVDTSDHKKSKSKHRSLSSHRKTKKRHWGDSSTSSTESTDSSPKHKKAKKHSKSTKKHKKHDKKKKHKKSKKKSKEKKEKSSVSELPVSQSDVALKPSGSDVVSTVGSDEKAVEEDAMVGPDPEVLKAKAMAPMTKEEWDKQQSVVRRVYDQESGRHRLIKGDGEVLEEIVSQQRHKEINKKATQEDGAYFQSVLGLK